MTRKETHSSRTWQVVPGGKVPRDYSRARNLFLWIFSIAMIVTAGTAFVFKLIEFVYTALNSGPGALSSFLIPVLTYLLVAAGFACLFLWAYVTGQFKDVEGPKYRMLELNEEWERRQQAARNAQE